MARIGFLGAGAMGARMAARLMAAGHELTVWNRSPERISPLVALGALRAETPANAARDAEFVIAMVRDDEASKSVWLDEETGALAAMTRGAVAIDSSTLSLDGARAIARAARRADIDFLDAPVAGSRPQAEAGQLIYFVGGPTDVCAKSEPILRAMGAAVHHAGPHGAGAAVKLAVNTLFGVQVCAVAELLALFDAVGIDARAAFSIVSETPVASGAAKAAGASMLAGAFAPMFPVALAEKDFGYARAAAAPAAIPVTAAAHETFRQALRGGLGEQNLTSVAMLVRSAAR